jgi:glucokinase
MKQTKYFLGIDIGGTQIKAVILDHKGEVLERWKTPTGTHSGKSILWQDQIKQIAFTKSNELSRANTQPLGIGISAPGLVNEQNAKIMHMPDRLKGIEQFDFSQELNCKTWVINDGHAACLAEYESYYKHQGVSQMIMLTLGTGVGGATIINGEIHQGQLQRAGHFGHMTVNHLGKPTMTNMVGSLEYAIGNFSVQERTMRKFSSTKALLDAYQKGDSLASYWWLSSVQQLATALASLINILSPECIVLGGGIAAGAQELLMEPLNQFMSLYEWRPNKKKTPINPARFETYSGAIGAAFFARSKSI